MLRFVARVLIARQHDLCRTAWGDANNRFYVRIVVRDGLSRSCAAYIKAATGRALLTNGSRYAFSIPPHSAKNPSPVFLTMRHILTLLGKGADAPDAPMPKCLASNSPMRTARRDGRDLLIG